LKERRISGKSDGMRHAKECAPVHAAFCSHWESLHYFRVDKPFQDAQGRRLENFTRIETFGNNPANGNNDVQWVKVTVDVRRP
jgi:hypothetical protein